MPGPLAGVRFVEIGGIGPVPFCGMMLADMGADVIRIDRPAPAGEPASRMDVVSRGRRSITVDLKSPLGTEVVLRLAERADAVYEGYRPGVAEKLGIGPTACLARNPRLVYGRMTGWGQSGPLSQTAGHDIDYIAVSGMLHPVGPADRPPVAPLHVMGNYGGGAMMLALGLVSAVLSARDTGVGQVVDASSLDGTALMTAYMHDELAAGRWKDARGANLLDGAAPFYRSYTCADGQYVAVGAIEPHFTGQLLDGLGIGRDDPMRDRWYDQAEWPELSATMEAIFATRTRDEWVKIFADTDGCLAPVLSLAEAPLHPHNVERRVYFERDGIVQPSPAPRFSETASMAGESPLLGAHTAEVLAELGFSTDEID